MDYLLYTLAVETSLKDALDMLQEAENKNCALLVQTMRDSVTNMVELLDQPDIVSFLNNHLSDQEIFQLVMNMVNEYFTKPSHILWKRIRNRLPSSPAWLYNLDEGPYPIWDECDRMHQNPWKFTNFVFLEMLVENVIYIPHLLDFVNAMSQHQQIIHIISNARSNRLDRILWWRRNKDDLWAPTLFNLRQDRLLAEIFFVDRQCMSINMQNITITNPCDACDEKQWTALNINWRCIAKCFNEQQCARFCISNDVRYCSWHLFRPTTRLDYVPFALDRDFNDHFASKYHILEPFLLLGNGAVNIWKERQITLPPSFHIGSRFTIMSPYKPSSMLSLSSLTSVYIPSQDVKDLNFISNIQGVWKYKHRIVGQHVEETYITWIQVEILPEKEDEFNKLKNSNFSLVNWDTDIFYCSTDHTFYINGNNVVNFDFYYSLLGLETKEQWFYTLDQIYIYFKQYGEARDALENSNSLSLTAGLGNILLNSFGSNPTEILETMIESNIHIHTSGLHHYIPFLLLAKPLTTKIVYLWNDIDIVLEKDSLQLWRSNVQNELGTERIEKPEFLQDANVKLLTVFGQDYDINKLLIKPKDLNVPRDKIAELPHHCQDLFLPDDKANVREFLEEKDESEPLVFLRKYKEKLFAVCMRKSNIEQFLEQEESKYYACIKEGTRYMDPARMYIKLNLFQGTPIYLTWENIQIILTSDYVYWLEQEHPFVHLPFVGRSTYLNQGGIEMSSLHCQPGTEQRVHLFFPVDISLEPQPKRRMVTMHT